MTKDKINLVFAGSDWFTRPRRDWSPRMIGHSREICKGAAWPCYPHRIIMSRSPNSSLNAPSPISVSSVLSHLELDEYPRHDFGSAILFYSNLGLTVTLGIASMILGFWNWENITDLVLSTFSKVLAINVFVAVIVASVLSILCIVLFRRHPLMMVQVGSLSSAALLMCAAMIVAHYYSPYLGLLITGLAAIVLITYYRSRRQFNMSSALVALITSAEDSNPALYSVLIASALIAYYYWLFVFAGGISALEGLGKRGYPGWFIYTLLAYLIFSYFWTVQVLLLVDRTIIATTFGQYFQTDPNHKKLTILQILRLVFTRSMGSICNGSFLVLPVTHSRWYAQVLLGLPYNTSFLAPPARNYNYYAFNNLILRRQPYREAAHQAWDDILRTGVSQIVQGNCVSQMLMMCSFSIALITAFLSSLVLKALSPNFTFFAAFIRSLLSAFVTGYGISVCLFKIIDAGTTAVFVVLAQDPEGIRKKHPRMFEAISSYYHISA